MLVGSRSGVWSIPGLSSSSLSCVLQGVKLEAVDKDDNFFGKGPSLSCSEGQTPGVGGNVPLCPGQRFRFYRR